LEHHGDIAILRRQIVDDPAADPDGAGGDRLSRRSSRSRVDFPAGAGDQHNELAILDGEVHAVEDFDAAPLGLAHAGDLDRGHGPHSALDRACGVSPHTRYFWMKTKKRKGGDEGR
jgi:hypothetical protein